MMVCAGNPVRIQESIVLPQPFTCWVVCKVLWNALIHGAAHAQAMANVIVH